MSWSLPDVSSLFRHKTTEISQVSDPLVSAGAPKRFRVRLKKPVSAISTTIGVVSILDRFTPQIVKDTAYDLFQAAKGSVMSDSGSAANTTLPATETAGTVYTVVTQGSSEIFHTLKTAWGWGSWAFKLLPAGVQLGLGLSMIYLGYRMWKGTPPSSQQNVHVNINLPQTVPAAGTDCKVTTKKEGGQLHVAVDCASVAKVPLSSGRLFQKTVQNLLDARELHQMFSHRLEKKGHLLALYLRGNVQEILGDFRQLEKNSYVDKSLNAFVIRAKALLVKVDEQIDAYTKRVLAQMKAPSSSVTEREKKIKK